MANKITEHSRKLRTKTAAERRARILAEGGLDLRALIEFGHVEQLNRIVEQAKEEDPAATRTSVIKGLIEDKYNSLEK